MLTLLKRGLMQAAHAGVCGRLVGLLERMEDRRSNLLRVLTYHRVDQPQARPDLYPPLLSATPAQFGQQMQHLAEHYRVVSLGQVLEALDDGPPLPPRAVLVTFDDAYRDFAQHAWPILQRLQLPVTLFVATGFPDHPERAFWWDRLHQAIRRAAVDEPLETPLGPLPLATAGQRYRAARRLEAHLRTRPHDEVQDLVDRLCHGLDAPPPSSSVLGWEALRQLAAQGVTLAPHTRNHPRMDRISVEQARAEAVGSCEDLRRQVGWAPPVLAYPAGAFTRQVAEMLNREQFRLAFTVARGLNDLHALDPLQVRRINVAYRTAPALWRAQLLRHCLLLNPRPAAHRAGRPISRR